MTSHTARLARGLGGIGDHVHLLGKHDVVDRSQGPVQGYLHRVLEGLVVWWLVNDLARCLLILTLSIFIVNLLTLELMLGTVGVVV